MKLMQIATTRFGLLDVQEETLIHFPWGIPGFEALKRYVFLEHGNGPFHWLQSVDEPDVAFLVCPPEVHGLAYHVPQARMDMLELQSREDLAILNLVSLERAENRLRFHIRSPLLFNTASRTAHQWNMDPQELKKYTIPPKGPGQGGADDADFIVWPLNGQEKP